MRRILIALLAAALLSGVTYAYPVSPPCPAEMGYHRHWEFARFTRYWHGCVYGKQTNADVDDKAYMLCFHAPPFNLCLYAERYHPPGEAYDDIRP